jgi:hypothetical protein
MENRMVKDQDTGKDEKKGGEKDSSDEKQDAKR